MTYQIVQINVSQTLSATPNNLQQRGAVLSFGSTMAQQGKAQLLVDKSEINDWIRNPISSYIGAYTPPDSSGSGTLAAGEAEAQSVNDSDTPLKPSPAAVETGYTTFLLTVGDNRTFSQPVGTTLDITVGGCYPTGYNGLVTATISASNQITWQMENVQYDGSPTQLGYISLPNADSVNVALQSFFAQGDAIGCYLLDLGMQSEVAAEISALSDYVADPDTRMYGYVVPPSWDGVDQFVQLANNYTANDQMVYFFVATGAPQNSRYTSPYSGLKSVVAIIDENASMSGADAPTSNMSAAFMYQVVSMDPSPVNKVGPYAFRYVQGATPVDYKNSVIAALVAANVNFIQTGAEGGISRNIFALGVASDGNDFSYWYSVDWIQINVHLQLANTVINGSNNPINPLYYDQDGIERLQQTAQGVFNTGTAYGLVNGTATVNAIAFRQYVQLNPNDYGQGRYAGLSAEYTPNRGFLKIVFNVNVNLNPQGTTTSAQGA